MWIHNVDPLFMFSTPTFFLILVTLPTITEQVPSRETKPEWTECGVKTKCYCLDSQGGLNEYDNTQTLPDECAKAGAQNRFFARESALFQFYIADQPPGKKLMVLLGTEEKFGCEFDKSGNAKLIGDDLLKIHRMTLFEDRSRSLQGYSICAIKAERMKTLYQLFHGARKNEGRKPTIVLSVDDTTTFPVPFTTNEAEALFDIVKDNGAMKCDPYSFEDKTSHIDQHVLPVVNRDADVLDCKSYGVGTYKMKYDKGTSEFLDLVEVTCKDDAGTYYYELNDGSTLAPGEAYPRLEEGEKYTIYCAAPIGEVCQNPNPDCPPTRPECPKYLKGGPGNPATLKCDHLKWLVKDEYLKLAKDPECKADDMSGENTAAFFISQDSGTDRRVDGARCFTDYDCNKTATIFLDDSMEYSNGEVKCSDKNIVMEIHFYEKNETLSATSFACDKADGQWKNKTSSGALTEVIPAGSQLRCPIPNDEAAAQTGEVAMSDGAIIGIIVGASVGFLILSAVVIFGVLYYKKNRRVKTIDKDALRKMDQAERIKHCREFFPMVLNTTPTTTHHIIDGLIELDVLLEMEIEDPDVWDTVYPFIMRVHGAVYLMDPNIGKMFDRYLYLKAKIIINKNGWTSKTPIRKNNTDGLIRCVAINLLAFSITFAHVEETKKLILNGFRKLGLRGRSQYPHCGLLWSVVSHVRKQNQKNKTGDKRSSRNSFDRDKFQSRLLIISTSKKSHIPPDELIPNFGSVPEQAVFAHGAWQSVYDHTNVFGPYVKRIQHEGNKDAAKLATTYMAGMAQSITRCPGQTILITCMQIPKSNPKAFELLYSVAPPEEWNIQIEKAYPICYYYGRHMDVNKLDEKFITKAREPSAKLQQMRVEQADFVAAMDKQLEELREWYAEHTDKDELKKKPVYVINEKFKQANRNSGPNANPNLNPGDGPKSAGETKSNSGGAPTGKSQTDVKSSEGSSNTPEKPASETPAPENPTPAPAPEATPGPPSAPPST